MRDSLIVGFRGCIPVSGVREIFADLLVAVFIGTAQIPGRIRIERGNTVGSRPVEKFLDVGRKFRRYCVNRFINQRKRELGCNRFVGLIGDLYQVFRRFARFVSVLVRRNFDIQQLRGGADLDRNCARVKLFVRGKAHRYIQSWRIRSIRGE